MALAPIWLGYAKLNAIMKNVYCLYQAKIVSCAVLSLNKSQAALDRQTPQYLSMLSFRK